MTGLGLPPRELRQGTTPGMFDRVLLSCRVTVGGERIEVWQMIAREVYNDSTARPLIEQHLRRQLMDAILEKWTPVIHVDM